MGFHDFCTVVGGGLGGGVRRLFRRYRVQPSRKMIFKPFLSMVCGNRNS
jgi:hypothetical protein